ncbi:MAG: TetR/AcrR family transcriptional regulator [Pseudomonadota bacterium]
MCEESGNIQLSAGRPREFDEGSALASILDVFWEKGFDGTSLSDLVEATGVRKASLYKSFGNKQSMYRHALGLYEARFIASAAEDLAAEGSLKERLDRFLSLPINARWRDLDLRGCFLCNASADVAVLDEDVRRKVIGARAKLIAAAENAFASDGSFIQPDESQRNAHFIVAVYSGLRLMARSGETRQVMEDAKNKALDTLEAGP